MSSEEEVVDAGQRPSEEAPAYVYCPIRYGEVYRLYMHGTIVFVEIRLGRFANLARWRTGSEGRVRFNRALADRTGAINPETKHGHFFDVLEDTGWDLWSEETREGADWETVVDELAHLSSMRDCLFYRVRGFFMPASRRGAVMRILPSVLRYGTEVFAIPMSRAVDLRLLFYRPSNAIPKTIPATFEVIVDESGFSEVPNNRFELASRYDEVTIQLASRRVFENILSPVSIRVTSTQPENVLASEPTLLCSIDVPQVLMVILLAALLLAPLLLSLTSEDVGCLSQKVPTLGRILGVTTTQCDIEKLISGWAKLAGAVVTAVAGFIIFRRWPVSK